MIGIFIRIVSFSYSKVAMMGILLAGVYYFLSFQDTLTNFETKQKQLNASLAAEKEKEQDTKATESNAERIKASVKELNSNLETVQKTLPSNITTSDVISYIETFSREAQIQIKEKNPLVVVKEDITEKLPVKILFTTTYKKLGKFFVEAANNDRIITIPRYTLRRSSDPSLETSIDVEVELNGYRAVDQKEDVGEKEKK